MIYLKCYDHVDSILIGIHQIIQIMLIHINILTELGLTVIH